MGRLPNQKYTKEFKEKAARRLQIPKETLHGRIKKYQVSATVAGKEKRGYEVNRIKVENTQLRRELAEASMERDILKKHGVLHKIVAARFAFIKTMRLQYPIKIMCRVLN